MAEPFKLLKSGKFVKPFPSGGVPEPAAALAPAYASVNALTDAALDKVAAINADQNLSPVGRKSALRDWFTREAAPVIKRCRDAMAKADSELDALRASMATSAIDKSDLAGALLRQETRSWLRTLEPARRSALLAVGPVDPLISAAVAEAPIELSGVTANQKASIEAQAIALAHPDKVRVVQVTEEAIEATAMAERAAAGTLQDAIGLTRGELDEALGAPSRLERIRARLGEPESAAVAGGVSGRK
ncbi:hypothetical protein LJR225_000723 [Phenylobacterium sp. LjRoot225]|uniref:hypothetical protein n=1 Tax=Phenylobacterium sp. LjRoot225 TaxID=3342285 RepID=UPI003ECF1C36